ncbi:MAG: redoxin domain-containing protein [Flavobacteriia bacterium]|nr:redoxin domain-containing protein [Flavobacteriia bacterium]
MKKLGFLLGVIAIGVGLTSFEWRYSLGLGDMAPLSDREMENVDGEMVTLNSELDENGLLVIFSCNTCPFVIGWEDQYPGLHEYARENGIGMVLVNSNERFRDGDDSMEEMREHYESAGYTCKYVVDESAALANAFEAQTTPHVYLFNSDLKLVFEGSINDKFENRDKVATQEWLRDAMSKLAAGQEDQIDPADTRQIGCSIKRN